jgi:hypothetical protein
VVAFPTIATGATPKILASSPDTSESKDRFVAADIRRCYAALPEDQHQLVLSPTGPRVGCRAVKPESAAPWQREAATASARRHLQTPRIACCGLSERASSEAKLLITILKIAGVTLYVGREYGSHLGVRPLRRKYVKLGHRSVVWEWPSPRSRRFALLTFLHHASLEWLKRPDIVRI